MNKIKTITLGISLLCSSKVFSQITKQDIEFIFEQKPYTEIDRILYTQGLKGDVQSIGGEIKQRYDAWNVKAEKEKYELKDNALYLISYEDKEKNRIKEVFIFPYDKIAMIKLVDNEITIDLLD